MIHAATSQFRQQRDDSRSNAVILPETPRFTRKQAAAGRSKTPPRGKTPFSAQKAGSTTD